MSELPEAVDPDAFFAFVMKLSELVESLGQRVILHENDLHDLTVKLEEERSARLSGDHAASLALEALTETIDALDHRVTDVHTRALRALNARYGTKEPA